MMEEEEKQIIILLLFHSTIILFHMNLVCIIIQVLINIFYNTQ